MNIQTTLCATALLLMSGVAHAQSMQADLGRFEYTNSCSACHGMDGRGEGSIAAYLNVALPDLTMLQKNNGGVFPVTAIFETIEGGPAEGPHGTRDMPAWGQRLTVRAEGDPDFVEAPEYVRLRILALIEYLSTIQE